MTKNKIKIRNVNQKLTKKKKCDKVNLLKREENVMILNVYNIFDESCERFVHQCWYENDKKARQFETLLMKKGAYKHQFPTMADYPNTFLLYKVATYDDKTGIYKPLDVKELQFSYNTLISDAEEQAHSIT